MESIKYTALWALVLLAVSSSTAVADGDVSVETVLRMNLKATRGESELGTIRTMEKRLRISEGGRTLFARYRATEDGAMRIDVFADSQRVFSEGIDDLGVWEWPGDQLAPGNATRDSAAALEHGIEFNLFPLADLVLRGHRVALIGREEIHGNRYFVLMITLKDGFETWRYVNEETWLVEISRDYRAIHPAIDPTRKNMETRYDQFERTNGLLSAGRSQQFEQSSDEAIQTTLVLGTRYNVPRSNLNLGRNYVPDRLR